MPSADARPVLLRGTEGGLGLRDRVRRPADAVRRVADRLLDALVEALSPICGRWMRSLRLVAVLGADGTLRLYRVSGDVATALGTPDALDATARAGIAGEAWTAVELHLPPDRILRRSLRLPAAGRGFLDSIIEHRLERLTPWRPDRILYGYRLTDLAGGDDAGEGGDEAIGLDFAAVPRDVVATAALGLDALGLSATAAGPAGPSPAAPLAIDLYGARATPTATRLRRIVVRGWGGLTALLLAATLASLAWASLAESRLGVLDGRLAAARRGLRVLVDQGSAGAPERLILREKRPDASILLLIDRLATAVPDDSHLRELQVTGQSVRLAGQSRDAPGLIVRLEAAGLAKVRFSAPVTRDPGGLDSFEITAERKSAAPPTPEPR